MVQHESRPFGPYTEILLLLRKVFERRTGYEMVVDGTQTIGAPMLVSDGLSFGGRTLFYCHPLDYIWALTRQDLEWSSQISLQWQLWQIDVMAAAAEAKLEFRRDFYEVQATMDSNTRLIMEEFMQPTIFTGKQKVEIVRG